MIVTNFSVSIFFKYLSLYIYVCVCVCDIYIFALANIYSTIYFIYYSWMTVVDTQELALFRSSVLFLFLLMNYFIRMFFLCLNICSYFQGITIPTINRWPGYGFSFHAWLCLDPVPDATKQTLHRRLLYRSGRDSFLLISIFNRVEKYFR